jgi:Fur family ferric uptake transcriptional regulator
MSEFEKIFDEYLSGQGMTATMQQRLISRAFFSSGDSISAENLYDMVHQDAPNIGIATVWRTMRLLQHAGLAEEQYFAAEGVRYEKRRPRLNGRLICAKCGRPIEFETAQVMPQLRTIAQKNRFDIEGFDVSVFGVCAKCRNGSHNRGNVN